jgi:hypothetical protein
MNQAQRHIFYQEQFDQHARQAEGFQRQLHALGTLRLLIFSISFACFFFLNGILLVFVTLSAIVIFLTLVKRSVNIRYARDKHRQCAELNSLELNALKGDWSGYHDGADFVNSKHRFSTDMDVFGKGSFYQLINRTVSLEGRALLAEKLANGSANLALDRAATEELQQHMVWNQGFCAEGLLCDPSEFKHDVRKVVTLKIERHRSAKFFRIAIPLVSLSMAVLYALGTLDASIFMVYAALVLVYVGSGLKQTNILAAELGAVANITKIRRRQMTLVSTLIVENQDFKNYIESRLKGDESLLNALTELEKLQERIDYRMNLPVGVLLNVFLAWDLQLHHQLEQWQTKFKKDFNRHLELFPALEVWVSAAVYRFNNPSSVFAELEADCPPNITNLQHPFVPEETRIGNSLTFDEHQRFLIITGPNMAGKSTFLRSVGIAFMSANAGFPVLADECHIPDRMLYSSMRTSDDLNANSSYFHAELSRLKSIMDDMQKGVKVFVILDEILKGTNSVDKEKGSVLFLQKMERMGCMGIIATHDLSLCNLANDDDHYKNQSFDSTILNNELSFDYRLRDGVCQNMNATFLLQKMGLIDDANVGS